MFVYKYKKNIKIGLNPHLSLTYVNKSSLIAFLPFLCLMNDRTLKLRMRSGFYNFIDVGLR